MTRLLTITALLIGLVSSAFAAEPLPRELEGVDVDEQLGEYVDLDLEFTDHNGETVTLRDYVQGDVPVLLTLNYYGCPMLCGLQLNALNAGLKDLDWTPGENFRIVTISFDPEETWDLAAAKRASHLEALGRGDDVDWVFLVGDAEAVEAISTQVGFGFRYVEEQDEYAHPAALMFLSPDGMVARYLYGLVYEPRDLRFALLEAADGRVGSTVDKLILSCFVYDAEAGSYVRDAFAVMRIGGAATALALASLLALLWRRELARPATETV